GARRGVGGLPAAAGGQLRQVPRHLPEGKIRAGRGARRTILPVAQAAGTARAARRRGRPGRRRRDARTTILKGPVMILVTGGTGTSGSEIVKQLSAAGVKFRAMARSPGRARGLRLPGVEVVEGD